MPDEWDQIRASMRAGTQSRPWKNPVRSTHPECSLCCWAWNPQMGGTDTPFVLKFPNRNCRHAMVTESAPAGLLDLLKDAA